MSTTENPGTGPPIEDGLPVGPTLGAVLSKFCYVVLVSKTGVPQAIMKMQLRWAMCLALVGSCSRSTVATTPQRSRSTSSTSRHLLQSRSPDVQLNDFMTSVSYLHCQPWLYCFQLFRQTLYHLRLLIFWIVMMVFLYKNTANRIKIKNYFWPIHCVKLI